MSIIKGQETTNGGIDVKNGKLLCTMGGTVSWYDTMENSIENPQEIENRTTIVSRNSNSGDISKGNETTIIFIILLQFMAY